MPDANATLSRSTDPREFNGPEFQKNSSDIYKGLRDDKPVLRDRFHNRRNLSRYKDIEAAFLDSQSFYRAVYDLNGPYEFGRQHIFGPNILGYGNSAQHRWMRNVVAGQGFGGEHLARGLGARNEMWDFIDPIIGARHKAPGEYLLSRIAVGELGGKRMETVEIKGFVALLLAAGCDTTDKAIANIWYRILYTRPDVFPEVLADPELWSNVFTKMMRYDAVVHAHFR